MKQIKVRELEEVWYERVLEVPDEWTNEDIVNKFKKEYLSAFEFENEEGVDFIDGEYLYDTAEVIGDIEVFDEDYKKIYDSQDINL